MIAQSKPFTCEQCAARFAPAEGAPCARCGRLLCAHHYSWMGAVFGLYGLRMQPGQPLCRECRRGTPPPEVQAPAAPRTG